MNSSRASVSHGCLRFDVIHLRNIQIEYLSYSSSYVCPSSLFFSLCQIINHYSMYNMYMIFTIFAFFLNTGNCHYWWILWSSDDEETVAHSDTINVPIKNECMAIKAIQQCFPRLKCC
jgi:hypothetical protein